KRLPRMHIGSFEGIGSRPISGAPVCWQRRFPKSRSNQRRRVVERAPPLINGNRAVEENGIKNRPGSKRGNKSPIDSPFLERLFPPCCGWLNRRTPFHGGNRHGLPGYFVRLGHAM